MWVVIEFVQQLAHVGLAVVTIAASIAGTIDTRSTTKGVNLKTTIVSKHAHAIMVVDITCLLHGIGFKCGARFGNISIATYVLKRQYLYIIRHHAAYL